MLDLNDIDEVFKFSKNTLRTAIMETLREIDKRGIAASKIAKIVHNGLKENFDIEQIWERYTDLERATVMPLLPPQEIMQLRIAGWTYDGKTWTGPDSE